MEVAKSHVCTKRVQCLCKRHIFRNDKRDDAVGTSLASFVVSVTFTRRGIAKISEPLIAEGLLEVGHDRYAIAHAERAMLLIDDECLRVGSANLSNRSIGMDSK